MRRQTPWAVGVVCLFAAGLGGYWIGRGDRGAAEPSAASEGDRSTDSAQPVVAVQTAPVRRATITETVTAYGTVQSEQGEVIVVSVPYESRVMQMLVTEGQRVRAGDPLLQLQPSSATRLQLQQARNSMDSAAKALEQMRERYKEKLATNQDLLAAQQVFEAAKAELESLQKGGASTPQRIAAGEPGIVSKVDVQVGQVVAAGSGLVEIAAQGRIEVLLGVEPEDAAYLEVDDPVQLFPVYESLRNSVEGRIRLITQSVNADTRLIDVFVSIPRETQLLLHGSVQARLATQAKQSLVVPRAAALPKDGRYAVFTVKNGRAVEHVVSIGLENDEEVEVLGDDLESGDVAVVVGNYELKDGMAVDARSAELSSAGAAGVAPTPAVAVPDRQGAP